jgi:hypothetical protein
VLALGVLGLAAWAVRAEKAAKGGKKVGNRVFELRTYHAAPGKMKRFRRRIPNPGIGGAVSLPHPRS